MCNPHGKKEPVVRTILNIDNDAQSMILAGDAPVNSRVQLMMASVDGIAQGAFLLQNTVLKKTTAPELAL
jgi:hypothetical protein